MVPLSTIGHELMLTAAIVFPVLIAAVVLSWLMLGPRLTLVGTVAVGALMLFISLPLWLASIGDDLETHGT